MIQLENVPCLREHFERVTAEQDAAARQEPEAQYARAPDGPGFQVTGRPHATQRNIR